MGQSLGSRLGTTQTQDFVLLGLLALAGYVVYNLVTGVKKTAQVAGQIVDAANQAGQAVTDGTATALAKIYTAATLPPNIVPSGAVTLPNGLVVPASQLPGMQFDSSANVATFSYMGSAYQIAPNQYDAHGNLLATEVPDFGITNPNAGW